METPCSAAPLWKHSRSGLRTDLIEAAMSLSLGDPNHARLQLPDFERVLEDLLCQESRELRHSLFFVLHLLPFPCVRVSDRDPPACC